jgi:hypothetical protein
VFFVAIVGWLDAHQGAATVLLTLALVAVTTYYAVQNRRMVKELAETRELSVLPKLALEFLRLGPTAMDVLVKNVGPGPALDVDVRLIFEPLPNSETPEEDRRWRRNILAPGEQKDFFPPGELNDNLNRLPQEYEEIRLTGTMKDATGKTHVIDEAFTDLSGWRSTLGRERFVGLPERELAEALAKKFERPIGQLNRQLGDVARAIHALQPPPTDDDAPEAG